MITKEEYKRLLDHFSLVGNPKDIHSLILRAIEQEQQDEASNPVGLEKTLSRTDIHIYKITRRNNTRKTLVKRIFPYISAAVLLMVGIFSYVFLSEIRKSYKKLLPALQKMT
ncbi:hypothetical protein H3Z85_17940 [Chryseobacterium indologenes]|nr:hypothetical protein H3Z85_17940 [Chryseobacterium indologenes]